MMKRVLIVEDEEKIARILAAYMKEAGFETESVFHGNNVIDTLSWFKPDLILLDLMLPGQSGEVLFPQIKAISDALIIMVTAKIDDIDRLIGLEMGADDYVCKPFVGREVAARAKNMLRRLDQASPAPQSPTHCGAIRIDTQTQTCYVNEHLITLTPVEFNLITVLMHRAGKVISRNVLMEQAYGDDHTVSFRTLDNHIKNLRVKLESALGGQDVIQSVYGVGYKLAL